VELDWLDTFLAVIDRGGFTAAAQQVHRSQSRVSAHIAALERHLGVRLIDRGRRPAAPTPAGEVFARHAREIVAGVGSARAAIGALRGMEQRSLSLITTPCIGSAVFPGVLSRLTAERPGLRIDLLEHEWRDVGRRALADGAAMAVLPTLEPESAAGLRERRLWCDPFQVVVPEDHELARKGSPVSLDKLVRSPLLVCRAFADGGSELQRVLARMGMAVQPRVTADSPQTTVSLARAGVGVAVVNGVALEPIDRAGLAILEIEGRGLRREVSAYWNDVLLDTDTGRRLHRAVIEAPVPSGAEQPAARPGVRPSEPLVQR
jgi:DNA-binding transcriptional LysR family regulator